MSTDATTNIDSAMLVRRATLKAFGVELIFEDLKPPPRFLAMCAAAGAVLFIAWAVASKESSGTGSLRQELMPMLAVLAAIPIGLSLLFDYLPRIDARRRERRTQEWAVKGRVAEPGYFRLTPYEDNEDDREQYERPDGAHRAVLRWLEQTSRPLIYLTGSSGCGKTSLLNAYVFPELRSRHGVRIIRVRSFVNPSESLRARLADLAESLQLYQRSQKWMHEDAPDLVLRKVIERWDPGRESNAPFHLLIVFDQFEELMILNEFAPERVADVRGFIRSLWSAPVSGVKVLLSLRADYDHLLEQLDLPPMHLDDMHRKIGSFTTAQARKILTADDRAGFQLGEDRLKSVLQEAALVDDNRGMIRPIVINMLGRVLQRHADTELPVHVKGRLLSKDVRDSLEHGDVRDHAKAILAPMLSDSDTKRPRTVDELAAETSLHPQTIEGTLRRLSESGLVRLISEAESAGQRVWEISHDFVAKLIATVIRTPRTTLWKRLQPALAPTALLLMCFATGVYIVSYIRNEPDRVVARLNKHGLFVEPLDEGGTRLRADSGNYLFSDDTWGRGSFKETSLQAITRLLEKLPDLRVIDLDECDSITKVELSGLRDLRTLELDNCRNLETVVLNDLPALEELGIGGCHALQHVSDLSQFTRLKSLALTPSAAVKDKGLDRLQSVTKLGWRDVGSLDGMPKLRNLREIDIGLPPHGIRSRRGEGAQITDFSPLLQFEKLEMLYIYGLSDEEKFALKRQVLDELAKKPRGVELNDREDREEPPTPPTPAG
jgi:hypothetical protein